MDDSGNAYVVGKTYSSEATLPVTVRPDLARNSVLVDLDAFGAKINPAGTGLVYAGYIGGNGRDYGEGIAVDGDGNAYVAGYTWSSEATFPVAVGPDLTYNGGSNDAFVAKISAFSRCHDAGSSSPGPVPTPGANSISMPALFNSCILTMP